MLQDSKAERDLEKQIHAEDDLVQEEEDKEIEEELDEIYEENPRVKEVIKGKIYWDKPLPGGLKPSGQTDRSSQNQSGKEIEFNKGLAGATLQGLSREGWEESRNRGGQQREGNNSGQS